MGDTQVKYRYSMADTQEGQGQYSRANIQVNPVLDSMASIQASLLFHHNMHIQEAYSLDR